MTPISLNYLSVILALAAIPQALAIAGPACARHNYKNPDCVSKCRSKWGFGGHVMGAHQWGPVMSAVPSGSGFDNTVSEACGSSVPAVGSTSIVISSTPVASPVSTPVFSSSVVPSSSVSVSSSLSVPSKPYSSPLPIPESTSSSHVSSSSHTTPSTSVAPAPPSSSPAPTPSSSPAPVPSSSSSHIPSSSPSPKPSSSSSKPPASPSPSPSTNEGASGSTSQNDINAYLSGHNTVRAKHGAADLTWSEELATAAKKWASGCDFKHSGGSLGPYGENLAAGTGDYNIASGVSAWTDEAKDYNPSNPVPSHFTQVVWKATTQVGCALVTCPGGSIFDASYGTSNYIVCEYSAQGNVIGQFPQNVQA